MAELFFIRHGQASFGKANYDELSELGHEQTKLCGQYLFDHVIDSNDKQGDVMFVSGALKRQMQTMENILSQSNGRTEFKVLEHFNEFDHENVLAVHNAHFGSRENFLAHMLKQPEPKKYFHKAYLKAVAQWQSEPDNQAYNESFAQFSDRVKTALNGLMAEHKSGQKIVVASSAGTISLCLQACLGLSSEKAFALNDVMANGAISRVLFNSEGEMSLSYFNNSQYLQLANCPVTYR